MDDKKKNNPIYSKLRNDKAKLWSFSRCSGYRDCPYSYHLAKTRYEEGIDNVYSLTGTLSHDLLEKNYTEEKLTREYMLQEFNNGMLKILSNGYRFMTQKTEESYLINMRHYFSTFEEDENIKECEKFVAMPLWIYDSSLQDEYFQGWCDAILYNDDGTVSIGDFKTSTIYVGKDLVKKSKQLILYSIAYEHLYGVKVKSVFFDFLKYADVEVKGKRKIVERKDLPYLDYNQDTVKKAYKFVELTDDIKKEALDWLIETINKIKVDKEFKKGEDCSFSCKFICSYRHICDKK